MFEKIESVGVDQILSLMKAIQADPREMTVDLVVGVYKDAEGRVPVMRAVKMIEDRLVTSENTKTYVGMSGDTAFRAAVPEILFGADAPQIAAGRVTSIQTVGGSGALKVACDLLAAIHKGSRIWVGTPTWANHEPIAEGAGLVPAHHPYFRATDRSLDFEGMMDVLEAQAVAGDAIILHACCHNPTGVDLSMEQWETITKFVKARSLIPLVDCAYQGFGVGFEEDVAGLRHMAAHVPEMLVANSFSKNFGVYSERSGALTILARSADDLARAHAAAEGVIRPNYSMPPSHGARIVTGILSDPELTRIWREELDQIRERIAELRTDLRRKLEERQVRGDLSFLTEQRGMFSHTGFTPETVNRLREEFGVYLAGDGRMNVAGLSSGTIDHVADAFAAVMS